jgi:hypothetical protein
LFQRGALTRSIVTQDSLVSNFLTSAEYILKFGQHKFEPPHTAEYVIRLYRYILRRLPSDKEVEDQIKGALTPDTMERRIVLARAFLNTVEFRTFSREARLSAFLLYATLLQQQGSPSELDALEKRIAGVDILALIDEFIRSDEFADLLRCGKRPCGS